MIRIVLDAMGGDHSPDEVVLGAVAALREATQLEIKLVGPLERLQELTSSLNDVHERLHLVNATDVITNEDSPATAVRRKKDASLVVATNLLKAGEADALVTAGNTGAFMSAGLLLLGRLRGIHRPALAPILPTVDGQGVVFLDVGATMDANAQSLQQFALMGSVYAEKVLGKPNPRVGLLNVGTEATKGNQLAKEAYELISALDINFVGNVEARELLSGVADVAVAEGFVGNIVLKFMEGMAGSLFQMLKDEFTRDLRSKLGAGLLMPGMRSFKKKLDYAEYGGAPLLGVKRVMVKCHGSSRSLAIKNGILQAARFVEQGVMDEIAETLAANLKSEEDKS